MTSSSPWTLYVIVDRAAAGARPLPELAAAAIRGGADVLQLRDKAASTSALIETASQLLPIARDAGIPLIINDRVDVAQVIGADGVHLGQDDLPIRAARQIVGAHAIIGKSTHSVEQAVAAESEGADYIGVGPIFATPTKPDYGSVGPALISAVASRVRIPKVCIGGIEPGNIEHILNAGGTCVAVVRAVCAAVDPEAAARELKAQLRQSVRATAPPRL